MQNINSATKDDFQAVPQISSSEADSIIGWRNTNGKFSQMEQLLEVPGITNTKYEKLIEYFSLSEDTDDDEQTDDDGSNQSRAAVGSAAN